MNLKECYARFTFVTGSKVGRYRYEALAEFETENGFAYQKLNLGFQPFNREYFVKNLYLNTEGAWIDEDGEINVPINPLPDELKKRQWSAIRHVFDNNDSWQTCYRKMTGQEKLTKLFNVGDGLFWINEIPKIRKIDFTNFLSENRKNEVIIIAEKGEIKY